MITRIMLLLPLWLAASDDIQLDIEGSTAQLSGFWSVSPLSACEFEAVSFSVLAACTDELDPESLHFNLSSYSQFEFDGNSSSVAWVEVTDAVTQSSSRLSLRPQGSTILTPSCAFQSGASFRLPVSGMYVVSLCGPGSSEVSVRV